MVFLLQPSYMFTNKEHRGPFAFSDELGNLSIGVEFVDNVVPAQRVEANDKDLLLSTSELEESGTTGNNGATYNAPLYDASSAPLVALDTQPVAQAPQTSLAIDDLLGLNLTTTAAPAPAPSPAAPPLKLNAKAALDPGTFQQKWRQLSISISQVCCNIPKTDVKRWPFFPCDFVMFWIFLNAKDLLVSAFRKRLISAKGS